MLQTTQFTLSDFYAEWLLLKNGIEKRAVHVSEEQNDVCKQLLVAIRNHSAQLLSNPLLVAAVYLDPRFTKTMKTAARTLAISKLMKIWQRLSEESGEPPEESDSNNPNDNNTRRSSLLEQLLAAVEGDGETQVAQHETEQDRIHRLLQEFGELPREKTSTKVLEYWEKNKETKPELFMLSQLIFINSPTQTPTERSFSAFNHIYQPRRSNLKSELLEDILLIYLNKDLFQNVVDKHLNEE